MVSRETEAFLHPQSCKSFYTLTMKNRDKNGKKNVKELLKQRWRDPKIKFWHTNNNINEVKIKLKKSQTFVLNEMKICLPEMYWMNEIKNSENILQTSSQ